MSFKKTSVKGCNIVWSEYVSGSELIIMITETKIEIQGGPWKEEEKKRENSVNQARGLSTWVCVRDLQATIKLTYGEHSLNEPKLPHLQHCTTVHARSLGDIIA